MAKGKIIDAGALYKSGVAGRDAAAAIAKQTADKQRAFTEGLVKTAYSLIGREILGQVKRNYATLQHARNTADSATALVDLQIDKMPKEQIAYKEGDMTLPETVVELRRLYDKAVRKASWGFGKKRAEGRQEAKRYLEQLHNMNKVLGIIQTKAKTSNDILLVESGKVGQNNQGDMKGISPGSGAHATGNTYELGIGDIQKRLRWNIDTGKMEVQIGGVWEKDEYGRRVYVEKTDSVTGTYEDYVEEMSEIDYGPGTRYGKGNLQNLLSKEEWTELNKENRGLFDQIPFSDLRFADEEAPTMADDIVALQKELINGAYSSNSMSWDDIESNETHFLELQNAIGNYTDVQFKDFYFGGYSLDHSTGRMGESAPAYIRLKAEDEARGNLNEDGTWKQGFGPGSENWEGRLATLKEQSFVKGSRYRREVTQDIWNDWKTKYKNARRQYKTDNPKPTDEVGILWHGQRWSQAEWRDNQQPFINKLESEERDIVSFNPIISGGPHTAYRKKDGQWQGKVYYEDKDGNEWGEWVDIDKSQIAEDNKILDYITQTGLPSATRGKQSPPTVIPGDFDGDGIPNETDPNPYVSNDPREVK